MTQKSFICRCEDITEEEIIQAIRNGCTTVQDLKSMLRLGMGPCQGRVCLRLAQRILCKETGKKIEDLSIPTTRSPLVPVSIGTFSCEEK